MRRQVDEFLRPARVLLAELVTVRSGAPQHAYDSDVRSIAGALAIASNNDGAEPGYLRLGALYALHLLYRDQHRMGDLGGSADYCNLWELLATGLEGPEDHPQVPLAEIVEYVEAQIARGTNFRPVPVPKKPPCQLCTKGKIPCPDPECFICASDGLCENAQPCTGCVAPSSPADLAELAQHRIRWARISGALCDASTVDTDDFEKGIRELIAERDALKRELDSVRGST
jgi:hypothetical protein